MKQHWIVLGALVFTGAVVAAALLTEPTAVANKKAASKDIDPSIMPESVQKKLNEIAATHRRDGIKPRTRHLNRDGSAIFTNRLITTSSPYLQQHAHNPVSWFPWGDEAFELAKKLDRPIFLSIGYATCHWCHVMEEESFEDPEIAAFLNTHFIPIKVDRETRPDVDRIYMSAVTRVLGRGGWPANLVLRPDRKPFFAATYLPPRDGMRGRQRGFLSTITAIAETWTTDRDQLNSLADRLTAAVRADLRAAPNAALPGPHVLEQVVRQTKSRFDDEVGGRRGSPKFPSSTPLRLLLASGPEGMAMATKTLNYMAAGGIYDQVGGGFHRYSVDARWQVPHFEKMLYDNALLSRAYGEAFQATGDPIYKDIIEETLQCMSNDLGVSGGGFASALDADSIGPGGEREEGYYYTWTPAELQQVLGEDAAHAARVYGVTPQGNHDGRTVLHFGAPPSLQTRRSVSTEIRATLQRARRERAAPLRDDKIITGWNGLAIASFAYNGWLLGREDWINTARRTADRLLRNRVDGRLVRVDGPEGPEGVAFLDDYAFLMDGLLTLFEATGEARWLEETLALERTAREFYGDDGAWFRTPSDHEELLTRDKPSHDSAIPSANSVLIGVLYRLAAVTGEDVYRERAETIAAGLSIARAPSAFPNAVLALDARVHPLKEIVYVTEHGERSSAMKAAIRSIHPARRVLIPVHSPDRSAAPIARGKIRLDGPTIYVCENGVCQRPTTDPAEAKAMLTDR